MLVYDDLLLEEATETDGVFNVSAQKLRSDIGIKISFPALDPHGEKFSGITLNELLSESWKDENPDNQGAARKDCANALRLLADKIERE